MCLWQNEESKCSEKLSELPEITLLIIRGIWNSSSGSWELYNYLKTREELRRIKLTVQKQKEAMKGSTAGRGGG